MVFQIDSGSSTNRIMMGAIESAAHLYSEVVNNSINQGAIGFRTLASGEVFTAAVRYADDDFAASFKGLTTNIDSIVTVPTNLTTMLLGNRNGVTKTVRIRDFRLFPYSSPSATPGWSNAILETISGA